MDHLHDTSSRNVVVIVIGTVFVISFPSLPTMRFAVGTSFSLHARSSIWLKPADAASTTCHFASLDILIDLLALDFVFTLQARCGGKRAMTLNQLFRSNPGMALKVIYILGKVGEELILLLEQTDKSMCGRVATCRGQDVLRYGVEF